MTAAADRAGSSCGPAEWLALFQDEQAQRIRRSVVAENRSRDRIGHHQPHTEQVRRRAAHWPQRTGHGGRSRGEADHRENVTNHSDEIGRVETEGDTEGRIEKQMPRERKCDLPCRLITPRAEAKITR